MLLYNVSEEFHCKTFGKLQLIGDISPIKLKIANLAILDVTGELLIFFSINTFIFYCKDYINFLGGP